MKNRRLLIGIGLLFCFCNLSSVMHGKNESVLFSVADLKCENLINPLGIDNTSPHFSWKLKGDGWKQGQTYYEIQVSSDSLSLADDKADLWDTGKVKSDASVMVPYQGKQFHESSLLPALA